MRFFTMCCLLSLGLMFPMIPAVFAQSPTDPDSAAEARTQYVKAIQHHVETHWSYKKTLDNQFYSVQATIILDKKGTIQGRTIDKISPDKEFNISAVRQLAMMEPFPSIPAELGLEEYEIRILLMPNAH